MATIATKLIYYAVHDVAKLTKFFAFCQLFGYHAPMKYGHKLTVKIDGYDQKGRGMAKAEIAPREVRAIAVPFAAKGDELDVTFTKREYGLKICKLDKIIKPGPDRIATVCPHAGICGGCAWQHLNYVAQLAEKERGVHELFESLKIDAPISPTLPAQDLFQYRNRMDYCVGWNGEIGLKESGQWNKYIDIKQCNLMRPGVPEILEAVREWMREFDLQPWDAKFYAGDIRYVVIRDGQNTHQRIVTLVIKDFNRINAEARQWIVKKLDSPSITSILLGQNSKTTDLSMAESFETLKGNPWLEENINGLEYQIHPNSFFQTNPAMAARLQDYVIDVVAQAKSKNLLDMYCGLGFFGIAAAKRIKDLQVSGFELDEAAIKLASQNAEKNKVGDRCNFVSGKAEELTWKDIPAQTVILDPPRAGLHPRVIKTLLADEGALKPSTIIYVSCNYHRWQEELPQFITKYNLIAVQPIDLFPQTPHIEVVAVLSRKPLIV